MNKTTGFTLIELLEVIVILAIVALITIPIMKDTIKPSKKELALANDSMYAYIKEVEKNINKKSENNIDLLTGTYKTKDANLYRASTKILAVSMKGIKPKDDFGYITIKNGNVIEALLKFGDVEIEYDRTMNY